jgi:hypothetical protein
MITRLERLVAGELDAQDRAGLVSWLEEDLVRWRLCGLAFLEAQTWADALGGWMPTHQAARKPAALTRPNPPQSRSRRWAATLVSAASLLVAFALGLAARDIAGRETQLAHGGNQANGVDESAVGTMDSRDVRGSAANHPVLASVSVRQDWAFGTAGAIQIPVVPRTSRFEPPSATATEIPEYVREQWERRGFELTSERRFLFAELPDGEQIVVPVDQVLVHSIPQKVY